jgi:hypothetical protein
LVIIKKWKWGGNGIEGFVGGRGSIMKRVKKKQERSEEGGKEGHKRRRLLL